MRTGLAWAAGLAVSAVAHGIAAVILVPAYAPQDTPAQAAPETRLAMETVEAPRQDAAASDPEGETVTQQEAQGSSVAAGAVPQSDARPITAQLERRPAATPRFTRTEAAAPDDTALAAEKPQAGRLNATKPAAEPARPATPTTDTALETAMPGTQPILSAEVEASAIVSTEPRGETAKAAAPLADMLTSAETTGERAPPAAIGAAQLSETIAPADDTRVADLPAPERIAAAAPATEAATRTTPSASNLASREPEALVARASIPAPAPATALVPAAASAVSTEPAATVSAALAPVSRPAATVAAATSNVRSEETTGQQTAALATTGDAVPQARTNAPDAAEAMPPATSAKAALAWQFGDRVVTDPQALATIQAFMEPAALDNAEGVKDGLSSLLTGVDCARLSATFIPETGTLEMRGHIPDPELKGPILAALQRQVGDGIPVTANLLHLPKPQCGALSGIASVGLPQSTDQFTNARLVGETAHAREYNYSEGQRLQFDLTAPDYDAYVYVDYFNADGEVIHLVPNDTIPLETHAAKSVFGVGKDRAGRPGLRITIGPPFGQEIAVAFAASHPLYDGVRPIVEPAAPYLEELQAMVAQAHATHDDFKGEWVYFFITTAPATQ